MAMVPVESVRTTAEFTPGFIPSRPDFVGLTFTMACRVFGPRIETYLARVRYPARGRFFAAAVSAEGLQRVDEVAKIVDLPVGDQPAMRLASTVAGNPVAADQEAKLRLVVEAANAVWA